MKTLNRLAAVNALGILVLTATPSIAWAQDKVWTTVGSAGTVDEESLVFVTLASATARVRENAPADTIGFIRYNVVAVEGVFSERGLTLTARYFDREDTDRVLINLRRIEMATGAIATLVTLDSNLFSESDVFQVRSACNEEVQFDFSQYAYWVEVSLTKSKHPRRGGSGPFQPLFAPAISMVQIKGGCVMAPH